MKTILRFVTISTCIIAVAVLPGCGGRSQETPMSITTPSLPNGIVGTAYSQTIQASGGSGRFSWSLASGSLPRNLSLSTSTTNSIAVSGTPEIEAQGVLFTISVKDSSNHSAQKSYTISILPQPDNLVLSPERLDFSLQPIENASIAQTETLTNNGSSVINIASIAITGTNALDFAQSNSICGSSLAAGANCTFDIKFTPGDLGPRSASISITDDTGGSPQSIPLMGVGLTSGPNATLSDQSLSFNSQTNPAQSVTLSNYGTANLTVFNVTTTANFNASGGGCMPLVASGASCTIGIFFTPATTGDFNGTLTINDDAPGGAQTVSLQGTGATGNAKLNGRCWGSLVNACGTASASDPADCPTGEPAITPVSVSGGGICGPPVVTLLDESRACQAKDTHGNTVRGHCQVQ